MQANPLNGNISCFNALIDGVITFKTYDVFVVDINGESGSYFRFKKI